jgi:hypothetical protein
MVGEKGSGKGLFSRLELPKAALSEPSAEIVAMIVEHMKHQGEVAYQVGRKQAIALTSSVSTLSIGWSIFFFGIMQESWLSSSIGLMMVFAATYFLGYWTPRLLDRVRAGLDATGAAVLYDRWIAAHAKSKASPKRDE